MVKHGCWFSLLVEGVGISLGARQFCVCYICSNILYSVTWYICTSSWCYQPRTRKHWIWCFLVSYFISPFSLKQVFHPICNKTINQPTHQPTNQPTNQPTKHMVTTLSVTSLGPRCGSFRRQFDMATARRLGICLLVPPSVKNTLDKQLATCGIQGDFEESQCVFLCVWRCWSIANCGNPRLWGDSVCLKRFENIFASCHWKWMDTMESTDLIETVETLSI